MKKKRTALRRVRRWLLRLAVACLLLLGLYVTVLAFPQLIISHSVRAGTVVLYHDETPGPHINHLAGQVDMRLRASRFYDSSRTDRVFFIQSQGLYTLFARLSMIPPQAQGFCLSAFDNSFVSGNRVAALAERSGGYPRYSIWEGDPAHTVAHEIGHQYMVDAVGRGRWNRLPRWKQEGFPEYMANIGPIRADSLADLRHRVDVLGDDRVWGTGRGWDRIHYESGLLVEFLLDVQGYGLEDIVADSVTREETLAALMAWCKAQGQRPGGDGM